VVDTVDGPGVAGGLMSDLPNVREFGAPVGTINPADRHKWSMEHVLPSVKTSLQVFWR
jgi:hypothetical protein